MLVAVIFCGSLDLSLTAVAGSRECGTGVVAPVPDSPVDPAIGYGPVPRGPLKGLIGAQGSEPAGGAGARPVQILRTGTPVVDTAGEGGAAPRTGVDVSPVLVNYTGPDPAIAEFGAGQVGLPTRFDVTVANLGDTASGAVSVSIKVLDYFLNTAGQDLQSIPSIPGGGNRVVSWFWTPRYSTVFSVNTTATAAGDTDPNNDILILPGLIVEKWIDLCDSESGWTGDIGPSTWNIAQSVPNDPAPTRHSSPRAWHCGAGNSYGDNLDASLVTPPLDLTMMNPNYYVLFNFNYYGKSYHPSDYLECRISDDGGATWAPLFATLSGGGAQGDWYSWVTHWVDYNGNGQVDPNEPHQDGLDISRYIGSVVQVKFRFVSDATQSDIGFYIDDVVVRGIENLADVAVLAISSQTPERLGVEHTYLTTIKNLGQDEQPPFTVYFNVSDGTALSRSVQSLQSGESLELAWKWTPPAAGDFTMDCRVAPSQDEVPGDNALWRPAHVAGGPASILLVDDDSGPGNNGGLRTYSDADVERSMMDSLATAEFDTYLVANDRPGPPLSLLVQYGLVIWLTGYDDMYSSRTGTLSSTDRESLAAYLDGGGRLWLVSFEAMWDTWTLRQDPAFCQDRLRVRTFDVTVDDDAGMPPVLTGLEGDPVSGGLKLDASDPPAGLWDKCDRLQNASDAPGLFYQSIYLMDPLSGPFNALRHSGDFKLVFMAFEFSFIAAPRDRGLLADRVLRWLWGGPRLSPGSGGVNGTVEPGGSVTYNLSLVNPEPRQLLVERLAPSEAQEGWTAIVSPSVVNGTPPTILGPMEALDVTLEVRCPAGEPAGKRVEVNVVAGFAGSPYPVELPTATTVRAVAGVALECSQAVKPARGGDDVVFTVSVQNTGNYENRANLSLSGPASGWARLGRDYLMLMAGGRAYVQVTATVPKDVLAGTHNLTVRGELRDGSGTLSSTVQLSAVVNTSRQLRIDLAPATVSVNMAQSLRVLLQAGVSNPGNRPETATLAVTAQFAGYQAWGLPVETVALAPFEKGREVSLEIGIPPAAPAGTYGLTLLLKFDNGETGDQRPVSITLLRPDLSVATDDIRVSPLRPGRNDTLELSVMVRNSGAAEVRNAEVAFLLGGAQAGRVRIHEAILPQGAVQASVFHRGLAYGPTTLRVIVDPDASIPELSRENNEAELQVIGYQSDLSVGAIRFTTVGKGPSPSNRTVPAGLVEISAEILNSGQYCLDVDNVEVNITVDGVLLETRVVSVGANGAAAATTLWTARPGAHRIVVTVDPGDRFGEVSETNNVFELPVKVVGAREEPSVSTDWLLLVAGVLALVGVSVAFAWQSLAGRRRAAEAARLDRGLRLYRVKPGHEVVCGKCRQPVPAGQQYYKCGCGTRYHIACAPGGECPRCSAGEPEKGPGGGDGGAGS